MLTIYSKSERAKNLDGIREIQQYKKGKAQLRTTEPSPPQVIRAKLKMSQSAFAGLLGVNMHTLQDWEPGRRELQASAVALLRIAEQHPEASNQLR